MPQDLYQSLAAQLQEEDLKHHEKREDGRQRQPGPSFA
jgi:hypothetical protein